MARNVGALALARAGSADLLGRSQARVALPSLWLVNTGYDLSSGPREDSVCCLVGGGGA